MKFLCKLGLHDWSPWSGGAFENESIQSRFCCRCGLRERRTINVESPNSSHRKSFDEEMGWCTDVDCLRTEPHGPH